MKQVEFIDKNGTFRIHNPENYSGLYLPLAGETGLKSSITPNLGGDSKTDQNHFLLEPVSIENLHNNRNTGHTSTPYIFVSILCKSDVT
jgi:cellobiose phosphorylase